MSSPSDWIETHSFTCKYCGRVFSEPTDHVCEGTLTNVHSNTKPEFIG